MLPFYHQVAVYSTLKNFFLKKEEEEEEEEKMNWHFAWAAISVYRFRNFSQLRQRYFHAQNNRLIDPR